MKNRIWMMTVGLVLAAPVCWAGGPDKTPPEVDIVQPVQGATVGAPLLMTTHASDDMGIDHVECHICGHFKGNCNGPLNGLYFYVFDPMTENSGPCEYRMIAFDAAGNKGSDVVDIIVKGKNPDGTTAQAKVDLSGVTGATLAQPRVEVPPPTPAPFPVNPLGTTAQAGTTVSGGNTAAIGTSSSDAASIKPRKFEAKTGQ